MILAVGDRVRVVSQRRLALVDMIGTVIRTGFHQRFGIDPWVYIRIDPGQGIRADRLRTRSFWASEVQILNGLDMMLEMVDP